MVLSPCISLLILCVASVSAFFFSLVQRSTHSSAQKCNVVGYAGTSALHPQPLNLMRHLETELVDRSRTQSTRTLEGHVLYHYHMYMVSREPCPCVYERLRYPENTAAERSKRGTMGPHSAWQVGQALRRGQRSPYPIPLENSCSGTHAPLYVWA